MIQFKKFDPVTQVGNLIRGGQKNQKLNRTVEPNRTEPILN